MDGVVDCMGNVVAALAKGLSLVVGVGVGANLIAFFVESNNPGVVPNVDEGAACEGGACGFAFTKGLPKGFAVEATDAGWLGG